jgi:AcrR family transcriptional regulator
MCDSRYARVSAMAKAATSSPRKQPRQARSKAMVDAILDAAARVFVEDGLEAATTNRIAREAGVSVGSLYQYFPSKQAVLVELHRREIERGNDLILNKLSDSSQPDIRKRVEGLIHAMIAYYAADPEFHCLLIQHTAYTGLDMQVQATENHAAEIVRGLLRAQGFQGDADAAAFVLVHAVQGVTLARAMREPRGIDDGSLARELVKMLARYVGIELAEPE